jgi:hypothetical protein
LTAQVAPDLLPKAKSIHEAWKLFSNVWHPDDWRVNGFSNARDAQKAFDRDQTTREILLYRSDNPTCTNSTSPEYRINDEPYTVDPDQPLGYFAKGCACTLSTWLRDQALQVVVPADFLSSEPRKVEEICPCRYWPALRSWRSFAGANKPLQLRRIRNSLPLATLEQRVFAYKLRGIVHKDFDAWQAAIHKL